MHRTHCIFKSMKQIFPNVYPALIFMLLFVVSSCQPGREKNRTLIDNLESSEAEKGLVSINQIFHLYPSPGEMLKVIDMTGMSYDPSLCCPVSQSDRYLDNKSRTYMLGVYMADLAYNALHGRHEATIDYLEAVRSLSEEIRISEAVDENMVKRAKDNVEYLDSLYIISNEAFMNTLSFCDRNERPGTVVMLSAGAFIESLYLAISLIEDYNVADEILVHLADQKYTLDNFMAFAESVGKEDPGVTETIEDLQNIKKFFDRIEAGSGSVSVSTSREEGREGPKKIVIGNPESSEERGLTEEEFNQLKSEVFEIRSNILKG